MVESKAVENETVESKAVENEKVESKEVEKSFEEKVKEVVGSAKKDDSGKVLLPDGVDEALAFAAKTEIRRRDTQATFTQNQQKLRALEAENKTLMSQWEKDAVSVLSPSDYTRLDELKNQNPDEWREELGILEKTKKDELLEKQKIIKSEAAKQVALATRKAQLDSYNALNPSNKITDDVIANDIPPRIVKKLENNEIEFEQWLEEVGTYLKTPKKIKDANTVEREPEFSKAGSPNVVAGSKEDIQDYLDEIY